MSERKSPEDRLRELEDREQIRELCATYCFLVDDGRNDELIDRCFAEDAVCDFRTVDGSTAPLVSKGREEVRAFFKQAVPALLRDMSHTVHNHRIAIDGENASGECYFELTALDAAKGEPVVGGGRYLDRYRRVDGAWRFAERKALISHISPLAEGWAKRRFLQSLTGPVS
jgi:ketosteroid isomerase-like protein